MNTYRDKPLLFHEKRKVFFFCAGWLHRQVGTLHDRDKRQKNDGGDNRNGISLPRW